MKRAFKNTLKILGYLIALIILIAIIYYLILSFRVNNTYSQLGDEAPELTYEGFKYRDLNKNGSLDIYEDTRAELELRVDDVLSQMTLEEKAGMMFVTMIGMTPNGDLLDKPTYSKDPLSLIMSFMLPPGIDMMVNKKMNSFNIVNSYDAVTLANFNNNIQKIAERSRLGIPVTIATDPRHGTENNPGAALYTPAFSQWPSSLGLAATRDTLLVREFGDIARQEYKSVGITLALHPMADLATEPRWGRVNGTFGEDAHLSAAMTKAYVLGFQGDSLDHNSVACMTKHFSGGGPQKDGEDAHFPYGKEQVYPGNMFDYHLIPFIEGAFPANTAQIMPYYGIPVGQTNEDVAFAFNKSIITQLLRDSLGFEGVVCTDWNIVSDSRMGEARAWGVEDLTPIMRVKKVIDAGCDQFGGESIPEMIVELVEKGDLSESRLDESIRRVLRDKFRLGLFDDPYVEVQAVSRIAGKEDFRIKGREAQARSTVLLKNENILPLREGTKVYVEGMNDLESLNTYGEIVNNYKAADVIIKRIFTPYDLRTDSFIERFFHQGRLYFNEEEEANILKNMEDKPTIVIINLERPAILKTISEKCRVLVADFGTSDQVLADILFGKKNPGGKMPFELPSSWEAVLNQMEDVPYDSKDPLYPFGHGLLYE